MTNKPTCEELELRVRELEKEVVQLKRLEDTLTSPEEKWRSLVDNAPSLIVVVDHDGIIEYINRTVSGLEVEKVIGTSYYDYAPCEYHRVMKESIEQVFETGQATNYEIAAVGPDGSTSWYMTQLGPIKRNGQIIAVTIMPTDITDCKQAEAGLRRARREWENIFQAIGHPTLILDPQHRILAANHAALTAVGNFQETLLGEKCYEVFHKSARPPEGCPMEKMLSSGCFETVEMEIEALGGTFLVSCTPILDDTGRLTQIIHMAADITERKRTEEALKESGAKLKSIFRAAPVGIGLVTNRVLKEVNDRICEMVGYSKEELLEQNARILYPSD